MPKRRPSRKKGQKAKKTAQKPEVQLSLKERLAIKRKRDRQRKALLQFTGIAGFLSVIVGVAAGLVAGPKLGLGAAVGILYMSLSFKYPRFALWGFFIYLPFGGTITYAIGSSPLLQLAKDGFYIPALFGVYQYCRSEKQPFIINKAVLTPVVILFVYCCIVLLFVNGAQQLSSDGELPFFLGILGMKVLMGYIPLTICAYYLITNKQTFFFLMRLTLVLIFSCCVLAFMQYVFLTVGICEGTRAAEGSDLFKATLDARCLVGGALLFSPQEGQIRLPGTFVAPWQWGWFLISSAFLCFASAFNEPVIRWRLFGMISMGSVFVMALLSGQRIALALVPVIVVGLLIGTGQVANLKKFIPVAVLLSIVLTVAALKNPEIVEERIASFQSRWSASPPHQFIVEQFEWAIHTNGELLGNGLGRATNSGRSLAKTALVETYYPKLIYEIGLMGTFAFLAVVTTLTMQTFKAYRSVRDRTLRSYAAAFWFYVLFISYNTYYYPLDVDPVAVYYWFFAGVLLKLPVLDKEKSPEELEEEASSGKKRKRSQRSSQKRVKTFA
ncbi:MAG: hormogonium polysaccharide biosynthesis protein HpsL [Leptolyngbyaceae bacterium]|nr:hormogonium polysaccharide biosynthesis protein HpsL [Leptolyngbyaceae bacterium]